MLRPSWGRRNHVETTLGPRLGLLRAAWTSRGELIVNASRIPPGPTRPAVGPGVQGPEPGGRGPGSGRSDPGSGTPDPGSEPSDPGCGTLDPSSASELRDLGSRLWKLRSWLRIPDPSSASRIPAPHPGSAFRIRIPDPHPGPQLRAPHPGFAPRTPAPRAPKVTTVTHFRFLRSPEPSCFWLRCQ